MFIMFDNKIEQYWDTTEFYSKIILLLLINYYNKTLKRKLHLSEDILAQLVCWHHLKKIIKITKLSFISNFTKKFYLKGILVPVKM